MLRRRHTDVPRRGFLNFRMALSAPPMVTYCAQPRLDTYAASILGLVDAGTKDISLAAIAARVEAERGVRVGVTSIWTFLDRHRLTS